MRPATDRVSVLIRLGLAVDCAAVACLPHVVATPTNFVRVHASFAILAGALLVLSVLVPKRLPRLLFDPALVLATIVFLTHAIYSILTDNVIGEGGGSRVLHVLLAVGAALVAMSQMLARENQVRWEQRREAVNR